MNYLTALFLWTLQAANGEESHHRDTESTEEEDKEDGESHNDTMKTDDLRKHYLAFFEEHGHRRVPSDSLVPAQDPSLLFTGAGMNQFKEMFLGLGPADFRRAVSCQKCLRTGDLDLVGKTAAHHTFFEMLGNFSFGDYFKREAITWAWEFVTQVLHIDPTRVSVSVYTDDDEAYDIWKNEVGLSAQRIVRLGEKDNFWPAGAPSSGPNGVCGPCSELFYDRGETTGCGESDCGPACSCGRHVEFWNLVFTQYDRQEDGTLAPLPSKNIDTGMGLERTAAILQGVESNFQTDIFQPIVEAVADRVGVPYRIRSEAGARIRRIADHARAVAFLIADGVLPGNEGRGYVERKILRRAVRDGQNLGVEKPFLHRLVSVVGEVMRSTYPEILEKRESISGIIKAEEDKFLRTIRQSTGVLERLLDSLQARGEKVFPGDEAFRLNDTYGLPLDLIEEALAERNVALDRAGYDRARGRQAELSRSRTRLSDAIFEAGPLGRIKAQVGPTVFVGYEKTCADAIVVAILAGEVVAQTAVEEEDVTVLLDRSPFYGESGGQVGDTGVLRGDDFEAEVQETGRVENYVLHQVRIRQGSVCVGDHVRAEVDAIRRQGIARAHTATHMLHAALREVLGPHVQQAGSLVTADRLRFDFTHGAAVRPEELRRIETIVNERICANAPVGSRPTSFEEARQAGAMALFGEKYGDEVRVVSIGDFSLELCGGTHLDRSGGIGYFRIGSEASIGSGTRRIEAHTGPAAVRVAAEREDALDRLGNVLRVPQDQILTKVQAVLEDNRRLLKEKEKEEAGAARRAADDITTDAEEVNGVLVIASRMDGADPKALRAAADRFKKGKQPAVCLLAAPAQDVVHLVLAITPTLAKGDLHAGELLGPVASSLGGRGGGRPDQAQGGGKDVAGIEEAFAAFRERVRKILGSRKR